MSEVLTLDGLRKFLELKKRGEKLPNNYQELVQNYLKFKMRTVEKWREQYESEREQLQEALGIAAALNVKVVVEDG